ncbi:MAG: TniQ family protein [Cognaticolwellia sp.]
MLIRPFHKKGESFQSYVYRSARANGWTSNRLKEFLRLEVAPLYSYKTEDREKLKTWLSEASNCSAVLWLPDVWSCYNDLKESFDFSRLKVCPHCCEDNDGAMPAYWFIRQYLVCIKHNHLLIDSCQSCNEKFTADSFITGKCQNCSEKLVNFTSVHCEPDFYSKVIYQNLEHIDDNKAFISIFSQDVLPKIKSLNALIPLTGLEEEIGKNYWQRRFLNIDQLYQFQYASTLLSESNAELMSAIKKYINAHSSIGIKNLSKIFGGVNKYMQDADYFFYFDALKNLLLSREDEFEDLNVGLSWISKLFNIDETLLIDFIKTNYSHMLLKKPRPIIKVINIELIITKFGTGMVKE